MGGGLAGNAQNANISNSYAINVTLISTHPSGQRHGGLAGDCTGTVISSYSDNVYISIPYLNAGGLCGSCGDVSNSYSVNSTIYGVRGLGGLCGSSGTNALLNNYVGSTKIYNRTATSTYFGGLIGSAYRTNITNNYVTNVIIGGLQRNAGGLTGSSRNSRIIDSYVTNGSITALYRIGGITGDAWNGNLTNSTTAVRVFCSDAANGFCGGIVGRNNYPTTAFFGTNTWVNYSDDNATGCLGQTATLDGIEVANCNVTS